MAEYATLEAMRQVCNALMEWQPKKETLYERREWGELSFKAVAEDIETVLWLAKEITRLPTNMLPDGVLASAAAQLTEVENLLIEIDTFSITTGEPTSLMDEICKKLKVHAQKAVQNIGPWIPVLALRAGEFEDWTQRMRKTSADMRSVYEEARQAAETGKKEVGAAVEAARAAAGEAGAAEFTHAFRAASEAMEKTGRWWLWPTSILAALALALSIFLAYGWGYTPGASESLAGTVFAFGGRLIAISVLFYASIWSGRIALANMHLANVNKHRAVSIQTLQAFHQAAGEPATKDAVVLEAAKAVFENVATGYIGRQSSDQPGVARVVEVIKGTGQPPRTGDVS